jgi:formylglycine-generating enzyme required for sulfatase activity
LSARAGERTPEQERFLDQAITGLAQDGKIIPVRLSLFADMIRGKPWTPATLHAVGGTEGIGVLFLEEMLGPRTAHAEHRVHERACRAVLQALLPEQGTDIKGAMRAREDLLAAADCRQRPGDFTAVLRILDTELRLITPADPGEDGAAHYQLTHDFLVPALREWLTRRQRETAYGRAELCLRERAALWMARPEGRHLPSALEWTRIIALTERKYWTGAQQKMMHAATRRYGARVAALFLALALLGWGAWEGLGYLRAANLVSVLEAAGTAEAPDIIARLEDYRRWADPMLRQACAEVPASSRERLNAGLALLPRDPGQASFLAERLLLASPAEVLVLREALQPHGKELATRLWEVVGTDGAAATQRLNAVLALATLNAPNAPGASIPWQRHAPFVVDELLSSVRSNPSAYAVLAEGLRPARAALLEPLSAVFRDRRRPDYDRMLATTILANYAGDQPQVLAELMKEADVEQYAVLWSRLKHFRLDALKAMGEELAREPAPDMADQDKELLAKRQATAAVTFVRFNQADSVWRLFRHGNDPRMRSYLIHRLEPYGVDPVTVAQRLSSETDVSAQRALLLALGEYPLLSLAAEVREPLLAQLNQWYREHPDPGMHSAVLWLLRRWKQTVRLKPVDEALASAGATANRNWYINHHGQTFAVLRNPPVFKMGSPPGEADRDIGERMIDKHIDRSFAIATTPVTLGQFQRFLKARKWSHAYTRKFCPEPECPVTAMNWFDAAKYCRWLSEQEHVSPEEMCFPPIDEIKEGMKLPANYLQRTGYRLATEAEWEYACRAGAVTARYYGSSEELLPHYGWYTPNSQVRTHPVGLLKPNDFGLFDMHGNIWQWCQERSLASRPWDGPPAREDREDLEPVVELHGRVQRGGAFYDHHSFLRCAARLSNRPYMVDDYFGMRLARTVR